MKNRNFNSQPGIFYSRIFLTFFLYVTAVALTFVAVGTPARTPTPTTSTTSGSDAGIIRTYAGGSADGAPALASTLFQPYTAVLAPDGSITVVDTYNNRIRSIDPVN